MLKESFNNNNKNTLSETTNTATGKMLCKDGFCSLQNHEEDAEQEKNDMNLFDPI